LRRRDHGDVQRLQPGRGHRADRDPRPAADRQVPQAGARARPRQAPMRAWFQHHRLSLAQTTARLAKSPFATALNVVAIGAALALPFGVYCLLATLGSLPQRVSFEPQLTVFLARDAGKADAASLEGRLKGARGVRSVRFISRDAALADLARTGGLN